MLTKIDNKRLFQSMAGLLDIYSKFSVIVCQLQKVNQLPFERYDEFQKLCQDIRKMTENVDAHT